MSEVPVIGWMLGDIDRFMLRVGMGDGGVLADEEPPNVRAVDIRKRCDAMERLGFLRYVETDTLGLIRRYSITSAGRLAANG